MTGFDQSFVWDSPSADPRDETFGDVVKQVPLDAAGAYVALLVGQPYDGAVIGRKGAAAGPAAIRESLAGVKTHHLDCGAVGSVGDLGNLVVPDRAGVERVQERVQSVTTEIHEAAGLAVFLGGDNSLTVPNVSPLLEEGSVGVVNLDAHLDCREPHDGPTSGTPYRQLFDRGLDALAVIGARHFETSTAYVEYARQQGAELIPPEAVADDLAGAVERALGAVEGVDSVYVSLDVDVLDAAYTGASAPTPGGLTPRELFRIVRRLADTDRLAGFEVVECAPPLDSEGRTTAAAARAVAHALAGAGVGDSGGESA